MTYFSSLAVRLPSRIHTTEHLYYTLDWIGRERNYFPDGRAALANLQRCAGKVVTGRECYGWSWN